MNDLKRMDRLFHFVLKSFVERGHGPDFEEIGRAFDLDPEGGRALLRELIATGIQAWLQPGTDHIASFAPFNNQPTRYRVSIDGKQKWFAQCGFEALAISWLVPGQEVAIESPCPDCEGSIRVSIRDGVLEAMEPETIVAYTDVPLARWREDRAYN